MERLAPLLDGADIAFKKIDSLLRGHVAVELAACMRHFDHCVLAPAFPFQGRITRGGRQLARDGDGWRDDRRRSAGRAARLRPDRLTVRDAETDADLDAIVAAGRALPGRVLWCGTGGLAGALAGSRVVACPALPRPFLALIGSDHSVSAAADRRGARLHHVLPWSRPGGNRALADRRRRRRGHCGALPAGTPRALRARGIIAASPTC